MKKRFADTFSLLPNESLCLREVTSEVLNDLVALHLLAFDSYFLSSMGREFLKTYYHATLKEELSWSRKLGQRFRNFKLRNYEKDQTCIQFSI